MKKAVIIFYLLVTSASIHAQRSNSAQLEDSIFAWKPIPKLNATAYPRTFSQAQLKHPELFAQWLQKSYMPIGALDFSYAIAEPNKKEEVQPFGTGINAAMWRAMWDKSDTKVIRQPHSENGIYMITNHIIDAEPISMLTIPGRPVFTWRLPDTEKAFAGSKRWNTFLRQLKLEEHQQIGKYIIQYYGCSGDGCQPRVAVYLAPNNKLPIRQLTRGEVLDMIEQAIPKETKGIESLMPNEKHKAVERVKSNLNKLRDKYRSSLTIPAELRNSDIDMTDIFNGDDIFDNQDAKRLNYSTIGIYTYEDNVLEKSKRDQPLWICISWKPTDIQFQPYEREIHRSMITHFNFDYVYDFFFNSVKVKNKPYTILNEEAQKTRVVSNKNPGTVKNVSVKKSAVNAWYFEDFSTGSPGEKPDGWYMNSTGQPSTIVNQNGDNTNWLKLGNGQIMPNDFGKPLPENFKMEFDVMTGKDFSENTGGAFLLRIHNKVLRPQGDYTNAPKQIFIDLDAKSANARFTNNPTGYSRLKAIYTGMNSIARYADVLQYSNDFSNVSNKVHYTITKEGNKVRAYINGNEIIALDKNRQPIPGFNELPAGTRFTNFYFENISSKKDIGIYVTNIKIIPLL